MHDPFIPFSRPDLGDGEINAVVKTLRSGWIWTVSPRDTRPARLKRCFEDSA